jgi:hypothetical protein
VDTRGRSRGGSHEVTKMTTGRQRISRVLGEGVGAIDFTKKPANSRVLEGPVGLCIREGTIMGAFQI